MMFKKILLAPGRIKGSKKAIPVAVTTSQYLIPVTSHQQSGGTVWHAHALKVGSGVPVGLTAHLVCG